MLKGLKGILEKGLQIAAPFIGGSLFPGMGSFAAPFATGIASLLTGNKPKDALLSAGGAFLGDKMGLFDSPLTQTTKGKSFTAIRPPLFGSGAADNLAASGDKKGNFLMDLGSKLFAPRGSEENPKPSIGMQALATGIPAYLSYLAAKEDREKANVPGMDEYMSATDKLYGGQFERPPEERRIQNLTPTYAAAGGMMGREPVNGLKSIEQQPIQYSAATGQGIMGMAKGGDMFPRKTGQISGPGTKTSDSIPAMLSDGEFVQRTDAVNGAGVMMGAKNAQEAREKGADFMYALQDKLAKMGQKVG